LQEKELILLLKSADEQAFRQLVALYQHRVYNTALGLLQQESDAEDIAQEVFIQVYKSIGQFKGDAALATWLYRITVTKSLDFLRSRKRKKRFGFITNLFGNENTPVYEPQNFHHPGVSLDKKEDAALLFEAISQLPQNQQTAFILNKLEDCSYTEIAEIMQVSSGAVDSLLQRAKQNLRKNIALKNIHEG
jgi:RNA polymerase sigma-70 factor (ECF subfamily)